MKKKTRLELLREAEQKLWFVLRSFVEDDLMNFVFERLEEKIESLDSDIQKETNYVKWETDSYASAKADARKRLKAMKKNKQDRAKALKELRRAFTNVKKVKDVY
jgi:hypothetical protein